MPGDSSSSSSSFSLSASSPSSSSSSPQANSTLSRIRNIASHIMAPVSTTNFPADTVPQAPEDPLFGLMAAYRADQSPDKVDLVSNLRNICPSSAVLRPASRFGEIRIETRTSGNHSTTLRELSEALVANTMTFLLRALELTATITRSLGFCLLSRRCVCAYNDSSMLYFIPISTTAGSRLWSRILRITEQKTSAVVAVRHTAADVPFYFLTAAFPPSPHPASTSLASFIHPR